jgi:hypothetical protein
MKTTVSKALNCLSLAPALAILLLGLTASRLAAQSDNFNSSPPSAQLG